MKFGLMTQIQIPRPWTETSEREGFWNALNQAERSEQAGFEYFWITEQHFLAEIGHDPASDLFLAALSQRTKTLRLGLGVVLLPLHNPFMTAERVATLDVLSNGRVEFGTGRGTTNYMLEGFGVDPDTARERGAEALNALLAMYDEPRFKGFKSKYFDLPARQVLPRPIQRPHPPLWVAATNLSTYEHAARQGFGVIGVTRNSIDETRAAVQRYHAVSQSEKPTIARRANPTTAVFGIGLCHHDDATGRALACKAARWYYGDNDAELNSQRFTTAGGVEAVRARIAAQSDDELITNGMAIGGHPDTVSRIIEKWAATGIDQFIFFMQAGFMRHDDVMRSIELIGEKVIPRFA
jgi:alkanesulfonate monooxygenase SsuD/methylene tetrahydromethanopterin reductase-like flavin-dependent oxidoreductase (luciferase family)